MKKHALSSIVRSSGVISIPIPSTVDSEIVIQRLGDALPQLYIANGHEVKVRGYFNIRDFDVDEDSLYFFILTDGVASNYLYFDEMDKARADKSHLNIQYRSLASEAGHKIVSSVTISISSEEYEPDELVPELIANSEIADIEEGWIKVNVVKADSIDTLTHFIQIFNRPLPNNLSFLPCV